MESYRHNLSFEGFGLSLSDPQWCNNSSRRSKLNRIFGEDTLLAVFGSAEFLWPGWCGICDLRRPNGERFVLANGHWFRRSKGPRFVVFSTTSTRRIDVSNPSPNRKSSSSKQNQVDGKRTLGKVNLLWVLSIFEWFFPVELGRCIWKIHGTPTDPLQGTNHPM